MIDWSRGYEARWRVFSVDRDTWADGEPVPGIDSVRVERDIASALYESGSVGVSGAPLAPGYYRVAMTASQGPETERVDVATLLCEGSEATYSKGSASCECAMASVLRPADGERLLRGSYAPAGCDGAAWAAGLLRGCLHAPVAVSGSFTLVDSVVFDLGCTVLEAARTLLDAGGYLLRVDGRGEVAIGPRPLAPALSLDSAGAALLMDGIRRVRDAGDVANRYTAVDGGIVATAQNDDALSETGRPRVGYWRDVVDESPTRIDGETLEGYARRKLAEQSVVRDARTYTREWWPGVLPGDLVEGSLPSVGLGADMRVTSQSIACGCGLTVEETAESEERTWG